MDPVRLDSLGLSWMRHNDGVNTRVYEVAQDWGFPIALFSKSGGMGDIAALSDPAPIEIGNWVWNDTIYAIPYADLANAGNHTYDFGFRADIEFCQWRDRRPRSSSGR